MATKVRQVKSPNTLFVRHTADKLIDRNGGFCTFTELVKEVSRKYRDIPVRNDFTMCYLHGGEFLIDCKFHRIYRNN